MEHMYQTCDCGEGSCVICGGGLAICTVCGGAEGSLTTDCCGRKITEEEVHRIYNLGELDFKNGNWVNEPNYKRTA